MLYHSFPSRSCLEEVPELGQSEVTGIVQVGRLEEPDPWLVWKILISSKMIMVYHQRITSSHTCTYIYIYINILICVHVCNYIHVSYYIIIYRYSKRIRKLTMEFAVDCRSLRESYRLFIWHPLFN